MCGRYLVSTEDEIIEMREIFNKINERYKDTLEIKSMKTGEIFPTETAPVLVSGKEGQTAVLMKWGFPRYNGKGVVINARAENASEKYMFSRPLIKHRCAVPASGFFEWRLESKGKTKYLFRPPEGILYLAGLYDMFSSGQQRYHSYVILTTGANSYIADYHDRMPLILDKDSVNAWLADTKSALEFVKAPCKSVLCAEASA